MILFEWILGGVKINNCQIEFLNQDLMRYRYWVQLTQHSTYILYLSFPCFMSWNQTCFVRTWAVDFIHSWYSNQVRNTLEMFLQEKGSANLQELAAWLHLCKCTRVSFVPAFVWIIHSLKVLQTQYSCITLAFKSTHVILTLVTVNSRDIIHIL